MVSPKPFSNSSWGRETNLIILLIGFCLFVFHVSMVSPFSKDISMALYSLCVFIYTSPQLCLWALLTNSILNKLWVTYFLRNLALHLLLLSWAIIAFHASNMFPSQPCLFLDNFCFSTGIAFIVLSTRMFSPTLEKQHVILYKMKYACFPP